MQVHIEYFIPFQLNCAIMAIMIFITGGTFDKEYNELTGKLFFKDSHLQEMLRLGRCKVDVDVRTLMMMDSLEITDADRGIILENCMLCEDEKIVITHGTDTMVETARALAAALRDSDVDIVIAASPENVHYCTGYRSASDDTRHTHQMAAILDRARDLVGVVGPAAAARPERRVRRRTRQPARRDANHVPGTS